MLFETINRGEICKACNHLTSGIEQKAIRGSAHLKLALAKRGERIRIPILTENGSDILHLAGDGTALLGSAVAEAGGFATCPLFPGRQFVVEGSEENCRNLFLFLAKLAIESICWLDPVLARADRYAPLRRLILDGWGLSRDSQWFYAEGHGSSHVSEAIGAGAVGQYKFTRLEQALVHDSLGPIQIAMRICHTEPSS